MTESLLSKVMRHIREKGAAETIRKIIRHPLIRHPIRTAIERRQLHYITSPASVEERFTRIFNRKLWGDEESISGLGSRSQYTENLRRQLPALVEEFGIKSIFDAPCGDFYWMNLVLPEIKVDYIGGDIVKPLVELNSKNFQAPNIKFIDIDVISDKFPQADLWICRDCLFHLSYEHTFQSLLRFIESKIPYILTTTHKNVHEFRNHDIETGHYRRIDLFSEPYCFDPNVLYRIDDYIAPYPAREMCLWSRDQVIRSLRRKYHALDKFK